MRKLAYILLFLCNLHILQGQNANFSNPSQVLMYYSPAETSNFNGCYKANSLYRSQWLNSGNALSNFYISYEEPLKLLRTKTRSFGIGAYLEQQNTSSNVYSASNIKISFAYHEYLDYDKKYKLSVGLQGGILRSSLDLNALTFDNQYNGSTGFHINRDNQEDFIYNDLLVTDYNLGIGFNMKQATSKTKIGITLKHLNNPSYSFFDADSSNNIGREALLIGEHQISLSKTNKLKFHLYTRSHKSTNQIVLGTSFSIFNYLEKNETDYAQIGFYMRDFTDIILSCGVRYKSNVFNLSYDIDLITHYDALEFSFIKIIKCKPQMPKEYSLPCLRL